MARWPIDLWNAWEIQILVLLRASRCRSSSSSSPGSAGTKHIYPVVRLVLWLAYQLADSTAIYTLGHLSLSGARDPWPPLPQWHPTGAPAGRILGAISTSAPWWPRQYHCLFP